MWKIAVGFALFAALALFVLMKSGGNVDMSGEKHEVSVAQEPSAASAPASAAEPAPAAASAASQ